MLVLSTSAGHAWPPSRAIADAACGPQRRFAEHDDTRFCARVPGCVFAVSEPLNRQAKYLAQVISARLPLSTRHVVMAGCLTSITLNVSSLIIRSSAQCHICTVSGAYLDIRDA